jgi:hypothetical protein
MRLDESGVLVNDDDEPWERKPTLCVVDRPETAQRELTFAVSKLCGEA